MLAACPLSIPSGRGDRGARALSFGSRFDSDRRALGAHAHRAARAEAAILAVPRGGYARLVVTDLERLIDAALERAKRAAGRLKALPT